MPIHDFRCTRCGATFEKLVRGGAASDDAPCCPHCDSRTLERLLSAPAPPAHTPGLVARARRAAAREGHFSHYSRSERAKLR